MEKLQETPANVALSPTDSRKLRSRIAESKALTPYRLLRDHPGLRRTLVFAASVAMISIAIAQEVDVRSTGNPIEKL